MGKIDLLGLVATQEMEEDYLKFLRGMGCGTIHSTPCSGSTSRKVLEALGLQASPLVMIMTAIPGAKTPRMMSHLVSDMGISMQGRGVGFTIPMESVGGRSSLELLMGGQEFRLDGGNRMSEKQSFPCSLIVAIAESGSVDEVMKAARAAGAGGGTIVHAKGTAGDLAKKFFGVSLASEKDMLLIVARQDQRAQIMRAIMDEQGISSPAHTVVFSLPVENVVGMRAMMPGDENADADEPAPEAGKEPEDEAPAGENGKEN